MAEDRDRWSRIVLAGAAMLESAPPQVVAATPVQQKTVAAADTTTMTVQITASHYHLNTFPVDGVIKIMSNIYVHIVLY